MTRRCRALTLLVAAALLLPAASASASFTPAQESEMQRITEAWQSQIAYPGLIVGIWQRGVGSFVSSVGEADLRTGRPVRPRDHFAVGSITKTFTATLVLQLVNRGELHLQDHLSEYLRGVPLGHRITIRQLLNHTSGIHNTTNWVYQRINEQPHRNWRPVQVIRRSLDSPRYCPPGDCWVYSNTNYMLLGQIIRRVTHQRLRKLYERRIFDRVGLDETTFRPNSPVPEPAAHGYVGSKKGPKDVTDWSLSALWAAGAASSTLGDVRRWATRLATGRGVLKERMQRKRLRFVSAAPPPGARFGLGISAGELGGLGEILGFAGQPFGYDAYMYYSPSTRTTIVVLGNTSAIGEASDPVKPNPLDNEEGAPFLLALADAVASP
jgi:D-alanyl-D-alanine carboxypeptidase